MWKNPFPLIILFLTALCYFPAVTSGYIWDDDQYILENSTLLDLHGLKRIWTELKATPQYYPVTFTTFWFERQLWGSQPFGYHVVNVLIHILNALLIGRLFERLSIPGAWLAAALFAIHPVHVESVAWITERKNVLSAFFYLLSLNAYIRFASIGLIEAEKKLDESFQYRKYAISLFFFFCALGSKTVTCTLPAAILVVIWWKRGQIFRGDIWPLLPFFLMALFAAPLTSWVEQNHVGAMGDEWNFNPVERLLIAGRVLWFYIGKLLWPQPLIFIYPRWVIDMSQVTQFIYPLSFLFLLFGLWKARFHVGRGPLAAVLLFSGTLLPALGFIDFYPMRYSFVADHFQYLASISLIGLFASGLASWVNQKSVFRIFTIFLLMGYGTIVWNQTHVYKNEETLWINTIIKNPTAWIAHNNLGVIMAQKKKTIEAIDYFREAIRLKPDYKESLNNLGLLLHDENKFDEAITQFKIALKNDPDNLEGLNNIGLSYLANGNVEQAKDYFFRVINLNPGYYKARNNLGLALFRAGNLDQAMRSYQIAIRLNPTLPEPYRNIGLILAQKKKWSEAKRYFEKALFISPNFLEAKMDLNKIIALQNEKKSSP